MRLLGVELTRFTARALVRWVALSALVLAGLFVLIGFQTAAPPPPLDEERVREDFELALAEWEEYGEEWVAQCRADEDRERERDPNVDYGCDEMGPPQWSDWSMQWTPTFEESGLQIAWTYTTILTFLVLLVGVSFVAAEFSTGSISTWLTFEPRRVRVYLAKLGAAALGVVPIAAASFTAVVVGIYLAHVVRGTVGETSPGLVGSLVAGGGRVALACLLIAVIGLGLGAILRHTAAGFAVAMGWVIVAEQVIAAVFPALQRWLVTLNLNALMQGRATYYVQQCQIDARGERLCDYVERTVTALQGGTLLAALALVVSVVAVLDFRRRDVG